MKELLISRDSLKAAMRQSKSTQREIARLLGISVTALGYKTAGRKNRGILPFTETEVQKLRGLFGDSILNPAPIAEKPEMMKRFHGEAKR